MSTVQDIETALTRLSRNELESVRDFLDNLLEDELELSDKFKEKLARAEDQLKRGEFSRVKAPSARK